MLPDRKLGEEGLQFTFPNFIEFVKKMLQNNNFGTKQKKASLINKLNKSAGMRDFSQRCQCLNQYFFDCFGNKNNAKQNHKDKYKNIEK